LRSPAERAEEAVLLVVVPSGCGNPRWSGLGYCR
jgi:hypothetical protein